MKPSYLASITVAAFLLSAPVAHADDTAAETKFKAAVEHFKAQDYALACPEFEESERLDPNPSTEYFLAKCAAQNKHPAQAWNLFKRAAAGIADPKQRAAAEQGATDLNSQVGLVTLVGTQPAPGLDVRLDGDAVTSQVLVGLPIAVEPGPHVLRATAPSRDEWKREFTIAKGESLSFTVPSLPSVEVATPVVTPPTNVDKPSVVPSVVTPPLPEDATSKRRHKRHVIAATTVGVGAVTIVVGGVFGFAARSKWADAEASCGGNVDTCTNATSFAKAQDDVNASRDAGLLSNLFVGVGTAAVVTGVVLWFTAPRAERSVIGWKMTPVVHPSTVGVTFGRGF